MASRALVSVTEDTTEADDRRKQWERAQDAVTPLLATLHEEISDRIAKRKPVEERWLRDLRQYHGIYESDVDQTLKQDTTRSKVFINITRPKTNAWIARLQDMLFPNDERNWGIDPTPVPDLTRDAREAAKGAEEAEKEAQGIVDEHNASIDAGGMGSSQIAMASALADRAKQLRDIERQRQRDIEVARKRCDAMQREIDDQLTEARYPAKCRDAIAYMCKIGVSVMKGPVVNDRGRSMWVGDGNDYQLQTDDTIRPGYRCVNPWHFFPDMSAAEVCESESFFERHLPNKKMLRKMAKEIGFSPEAMRRLIEEGPKQSQENKNSDLNFLTELRSMENTTSQGDGVDVVKDRYVVWEYHGPLEIDEICKMLRALGRFDDAERYEEEADPLECKMVRVFFCNRMLLRLDEEYLMDSGEPIYSVGSFEKAEASIFGAVGVPHLMRSEQHMLNAAIRMMMDNAGLAVGPQIVIDKERIEPENGDWRLTPRKVWQRTSSAARPDDKTPPFETYEIPMNQAALAAIVELAIKFVDEAVSMPLIAQGEQGAHVTRTASGMSMLFNSANVNFRRAVKNWDDDVTAPLITRTYDFNMQFSDKPEIKGDMKVEARGTSVLLVREMQAEQLMAILREWSVHPILGVGLRAYHCMRLVLQAMNINPDDLLVSEEDYLNKLKAMSEGSGKEDPEAIKAQTQLEVAQIDADSRRLTAESNERIATMRMQAEFARLASDRQISLEQINAMFRKAAADIQAKVATEKMKTDSSERQLAAEIAIERENAAEARARGEEPTGSGGAVSMGSTPQPQASEA